MTVQVAEVRSYKIYVVGEVQRSGEFTPNHQVTVLHGLALAGGLHPLREPRPHHHRAQGLARRAPHPVRLRRRRQRRRLAGEPRAPDGRHRHRSVDARWSSCFEIRARLLLFCFEGALCAHSRRPRRVLAPRAFTTGSPYPNVDEEGAPLRARHAGGVLLRRACTTSRRRAPRARTTSACSAHSRSAARSSSFSGTRSPLCSWGEACSSCAIALVRARPPVMADPLRQRRRRTQGFLRRVVILGNGALARELREMIQRAHRPRARARRDARARPLPGRPRRMASSAPTASSSTS